MSVTDVTLLDESRGEIVVAYGELLTQYGRERFHSGNGEVEVIDLNVFGGATPVKLVGADCDPV